MIRLPDIQGLQGTALNEPQVNPRVAGAPAAALGVVAESIAKVSDQFHDTALRVQKLENGRMISAKRSELAAGYAALQLELQSDPDPASRLKRVEEFLANSKGAMDGADMPPAVRDELVAHHDDFATRARIRQGEDSARLAVKRAELQFQNEFEAARNSGDREAAERAGATALQHGAALPEEVDKAMTKFDSQMELNTIQAGVDQDPRGVLRDLEQEDFHTRFPHVSPEMLPKIRKAAEASIQHKRAEELDLMQEALEAGKLQADDLEAAEYLEPSDIKKVKTALLGEQPIDGKTVTAAWDIYFELVEDFKNPAISNEEYVKRHTETKARILEMLPPKARGEFNAGLSSRSPAYRDSGDTTGKKPAASKRTDQLEEAEGIISRNLKGGVFGNVENDSPLAVSEKAYRRANDIRFKVKAHLAEHPEMTVPEVREYVDALIADDTAANAARIIPLPGAGTTMRPAPARTPVLPPKQGAKDQAHSDPLQIPPGDGPDGGGGSVLPPKSLPLTATQFINE